MCQTGEILDFVRYLVIPHSKGVVDGNPGREAAFSIVLHSHLLSIAQSRMEVGKEPIDGEPWLRFVFLSGAGVFGRHNAAVVNMDGHSAGAAVKADSCDGEAIARRGA